MTIRDTAVTTHTINPASSGTVVSGVAFTPTAGNFLVCITSAAATSTTPTGWTLPTNCSAVNLTGLYIFTKTAAGGDTLSTTNNNAHVQFFDFFEFPAGSAFVKAATATAVAGSGGAGPSITALTPPNLIMGIAAQDNTSTTVTKTVTWASGVEITDVSVVNAGSLDGVTLGVTYLEDSALTSSSIAATFSVTTPTVERLMAAFTVTSAAVALPPILTMQTRRAY